jgi:hypothetical protein
MKMVGSKAFQAVLLLLLSAVTVTGAKVKRIQAGRRYKKHDAAHIVVNKVG